MTESNFNQNTTNKRIFSDFIYAMGSYEFIINEQKSAELLGKTRDIVALHQNAAEITETLLLGLQSIGTLIADALNNEDAEISKSDLVNTGSFINLIAESVYAVNDIALQTRMELMRRNAV